MHITRIDGTLARCQREREGDRGGDVVTQVEAGLRGLDDGAREHALREHTAEVEAKIETVHRQHAMEMEWRIQRAVASAIEKTAERRHADYAIQRGLEQSAERSAEQSMSPLRGSPPRLAATTNGKSPTGTPSAVIEENEDAESEPVRPGREAQMVYDF